MAEQVAQFVAAQFPLARERGFDRFVTAVGIANSDNVIVGGIVLSDYRGHDGKLSIYANDPRFLTPAMVSDLCRFVFVEAKFLRVTAETAKRNKRARRFVEGMGFRLEGTMRHGWHDGTDDMCIYGMTHDQCKWIEK